MKPLILINFKTYQESSGNNAIKLAKQISKVNSKHFQIAVSPSILTTKEISQNTKLSVFAQHADKINYGAHTGGIPVEELREIGVSGVLLNHSEYKIPIPYLREIVNLCRKNWLKTIVCASTLPEAKRILEFKPDYLAYEPEELIGGNISVTQADPQIIKKIVAITHQLSIGTEVLCGAGIHTKDDLHAALGLGAHGILLSHAVCSAENPQKFLQEMIK